MTRVVGAVRPASQHRVMHAVVMTGEPQDLLPPGRRAGDSQRDLSSFSAAVGEAHHLDTGNECVQAFGERDVVHIRATGPLEEAVRAVERIDGVASVSLADGGFDLLADDAGQVVAQVLAAVSSSGASVSAVEISQPDLEDVFLHLTGKALRD